MKVKLIQGGGFMGRSKSAEEDLTEYSPDVKQHLEDTLEELQKSATANTDSAKRDDFNYFIEYNGNRAQLSEDTELPKELHGLVDKLKNDLKY
jgi:hypothetical protein